MNAWAFVVTQLSMHGWARTHIVNCPSLDNAANWETRWTKSDWHQTDGAGGDWELTAGEWWVSTA